MDDWITSREAGKLLGISLAGVNDRRRKGNLTAVKKGDIFLFRRSDVLAAKPRQRGGRPTVPEQGA